jgi:hypothetical protein
MNELLDIRPSPRILQILGDIEFEAWQCVAELIDNAFDDFLELQRSSAAWPDGFKVSVTLPDRAGAEGVLRIEDSGRGMDVKTLNNAVRAGWSSNDRFSKLGLFGMGFNVATARLGRVARVFTTRVQDPEWIGVEIDLDKINDDFRVPLLTRPKSRPSEHGTVVEIGRLDATRAGWLAKSATKLRSTLGDVYSYLLDQHPFQLFVQEVKVVPRRACVWDKSRFVTYGTGSNAEQIPAVIALDHELLVADACSRCGNFQSPGLAECSECGSSGLQQRKRRIHGWLGIQRYLHKAEYGVDFLRNGRKILRYDKRLFAWTDPDDPLASPELEYPIEVGPGGRIIGEVHLDHVPVNYQKNAFEWSDKQWLGAVRFLRGDAPLLPKNAQARGYAPNDSPIARLHRGFRRNDPGYRSLVPGNGAVATHGEAFEWSLKFHKGIPEFQSDAKWWDAVVFHERRAAGEPANPASGGDVITELGLGPPTAAGSPVVPPPAPVPHHGAGETEKARVERFRAAATGIPHLSKEYVLNDLGSIEVTALSVKGVPLTDPAGTLTPMWLCRDIGRKHWAFIDLDHAVFKTFAIEPAVLLALEVAHNLRTRSDSKVPHAELVARLLEGSFDDLRIDAAALAGQARDLLDEIRSRMAAAVSTNPERAWQHLTSEEQAATEANLVISGRGGTLADAQRTGEFLAFVPATFIARLVDEWPEAFMDGHVFRGAYGALGTAPGRQIALGRIVSYLYDVAVLAESGRQATTALSRAALSLQLLRTELARGAA